MYLSAPFLLLSSLCLAVSLLGGPVWCVTTADNPGIRTVFTKKGLDYCKLLHVLEPAATSYYGTCVFSHTTASNLFKF